MKNKIGFVTPAQEEKLMSSAHVTVIPREQEAVKSIVQIRFPSKNTTLAYLNDKFDLHCGDMVYVDGKLAGLRGIVTDVTYNFKIKVSQYQKVIAVIDTEVHGKLYLAGSHLVSFNRETLPKSQILTWFRVPDDDDEYVSGDGDDTSFY